MLHIKYISYIYRGPTCISSHTCDNDASVFFNKCLILKPHLPQVDSQNGKSPPSVYTWEVCFSMLHGFGIKCISSPHNHFVSIEWVWVQMAVLTVLYYVWLWTLWCSTRHLGVINIWWCSFGPSLDVDSKSLYLETHLRMQYPRLFMTLNWRPLRPCLLVQFKVFCFVFGISIWHFIAYLCVKPMVEALFSLSLSAQALSMSLFKIYYCPKFSTLQFINHPTRTLFIQYNMIWNDWI